MRVVVDKVEKRSWVEIDLEQIRNNFSIYKSYLPENYKIIAVTKADAYGHGDIMVAKTLAELGVDFFAVSNIDEAVGLREAGIKATILILGYTYPGDAKTLYDYQISQTILSKEYAEELYREGYRIRCQVAIDTGMCRIGLNANDTNSCSRLIRQYFRMFELEGIFTHFSVADSQYPSDISFTRNQIEKFGLIADSVKDLNLPYVHCCNSAAGIKYIPQVTKWKGIDKYVRLGIVLYGLKPDRGFAMPEGILPALTWKSRISMVKIVPAGSYVGYGRSFEAKRETKIVTIPTGYADGYNRHLSNNGFVIINGQKAPVIGRVCMDQILADATGIDNVKMDDTVILLGKDGGISFNADDMAELLDTIGYEVTCNISKRVQRFYV